MSVISIINARIIDPSQGYDGNGTICFSDGKITAIGKDVKAKGEIIDAKGLIAAPGLIDMRVITGEPGRESRETLMSAAHAAAAGGVTSFVVMPQTDPVIDNVSLIDFMTRRGASAPVNIHIAGALTKGLNGEELSEIGLMQEAGAVMFSNGDVPITDTLIMRRLLSYSASFNALIANRAKDPSLSKGTCVHESDMAARLGLNGMPAMAERIMASRDIALAELTGGRLLIDMISSREALSVIRAAKTKGINIAASVSINHLALNEIDIGDYRTFAKLDPPLREEEDRQALLGAINEGVIDVIVSGHNPRPASEKRLPFSESAPGATGLELLLSVGLSRIQDGELDMTAFLAALTHNPAKLLGLPGGTLNPGAPADIVLFDPNYPWYCDADQLLSRSKNTPFDGRHLTGRAIMTFCGGQCVYNLRDGKHESS